MVSEGEKVRKKAKGQRNTTSFPDDITGPAELYSQSLNKITTQQKQQQIPTGRENSSHGAGPPAPLNTLLKPLSDSNPLYKA